MLKQHLGFSLMAMMKHSLKYNLTGETRGVCTAASFLQSLWGGLCVATAFPGGPRAASNDQSSACHSSPASASLWAGFHTISTEQVPGWAPGPGLCGQVAGCPWWPVQSTRGVGPHPASLEAAACGLHARQRRSLRQLSGGCSEPRAPGASTECCRVTSDPRCLFAVSPDLRRPLPPGALPGVRGGALHGVPASGRREALPQHAAIHVRDAVHQGEGCRGCAAAEPGPGGLRGRTAGAHTRASGAGMGLSVQPARGQATPPQTGFTLRLREPRALQASGRDPFLGWDHLGPGAGCLVTGVFRGHVCPTVCVLSASLVPPRRGEAGPTPQAMKPKSVGGWGTAGLGTGAGGEGASTPR